MSIVADEPRSSIRSRHKIDGLQQTKVLKIIIVGDSNVGKTCLTYRFCERKFLKATDATIGVDFHERVIKIGNDEIRLQLWDTAGQERFRKSMVQHYYRNAHAVVIVYDMTKIHTFNSVVNWVEECTAQGLGSEVPRVLVATQCDRTEDRLVRTSTAQRLADLHGMPLFETSAYLDSEMETVDAIFMTLAHKLYNQLPFRVVTTEEKPKKSFSLKRDISRITLDINNGNKCCQ